MEEITSFNDAKRLRVLENKWQEALLEELKELNKAFGEHQMQDVEKRGEGKLECIKRIAELRNFLEEKINLLDTITRGRCDSVRANDLDPLKESVTTLKVRMSIIGGLAGMVGGAIVGTLASLIVTGALK